MNRTWFLVIFFTFSFFLAPSVAIEDPPNLLVIYGDGESIPPFSNLFADFNLESITKSISEVSVNDIQEADIVIFITSIDFSLEDEIENALLAHTTTLYSTLVVSTPYLGNFEDTMETRLGISRFDDVETEDENETLTWDIKLNENLKKFLENDTFQYNGTIAIFESNKPVIASITGLTSSDEDDEGEIDDENQEDNFQLPRPLIVNASTINQQIITIGVTGLNSSNAQEIGLILNANLNQVLSLYDLILDIISVSISLHFINFLGINPDLSEPTNTEANPFFVNLTQLQDINFFDALIVALVAALILFLNRIFGIVDWIVRRTYSLIFVVVGIYYNVQDRTLQYNDVMMNLSRQNILDYLGHVGSFGAHLRELKTVTKLGTGSILWHLQVLEDFNLIEKITVRDFTVFVNAEKLGAFNIQLKSMELQLKSKYTFLLLETLMSIHEQLIEIDYLETETGITRRTLRRLLSKLNDLELIYIYKGRPYTIELADEFALSKLYESFRLRETYDPEEHPVSISSLE